MSRVIVLGERIHRPYQEGNEMIQQAWLNHFIMFFRDSGFASDAVILLHMGT